MTMTFYALSSSSFSRNPPIPAISFPSLSRVSQLNGANKLTFAPPQFLNAGASLRGEFPTVRLRVSTRCERENAHNGEVVDDAERFPRRESTMPDRFRYLTREAQDSPIRWPWFLGDPITSVIALVETAIYSVRGGFYSGIVAYTPVRELTTVILLASSVLAVGETVAPISISKQPYLVTLAGLLGYAAVHSYISEPFFWTVLVGLYGYSRLVKKRDHVTSALPCAAVLAGVGEPWVRVVVIAGFLALAMYHNSTKTSSSADEEDRQGLGKAPPVPLLAVALAIGVRLAAKWAGYRHLTWMIV